MAQPNDQPDVEYHFNTRFFWISFTIAAVIVGGAFVVHYFQQGRVSKAILERAESYAEEGKYAEASDYLFRYLRLEPQDGPRRLQLAEYYDKTVGTRPRRMPRAAELYEEALQYAQGNRQREMRLRLIELLVTMERFDDAAAELKKFSELEDVTNKLLTGNLQPEDLKTLQPPQDGGAGDETPELAETETTYEEILRQALRWQAIAYVSKFSRLSEEDARRQETKPNQVGRFLKAGVDANPTDATLALNLANALDTETVQSWFEGLVEQGIVFGASETVMRKLIDNCSSNDERAFAYLHLFRYHSRRLAADASQEELDSRIEDAESALAEAVKLVATPYQEVVDKVTSAEAIREEGASLAEITLDQDTEETRERVLDVLVAAGGYELARTDRELRKQGIDPEEVAQLQAQNVDDSNYGEHLNAADQHFRQAVSICFGPRSESASGEADKFEFDPTTIVMPANPTPLFGLAEVELRKGTDESLGKAVDHWLVGLSFSPKTDSDVITRFVQILAAIDQFDAAEKELLKLTSTIEAFRQSLDTPDLQLTRLEETLKLLQAELYLKQENYLDAIALLTSLYNSQANAGNTQWNSRVAIKLASAYSAIGQTTQAAQVFQRAAELLPDAYDVRSEAAELDLEAGLVDRAVDSLQRIANLRGNALDWYRYARARFSQEARKPPARRNYDPVFVAIQLAEEKNADGSLAASWPLQLLRYDVEYAKATASNAPPTAALEQLDLLRKSFPDDPEVLRRLVPLYERSKVDGASPVADEIVAQLQKMDPGPTTALVAANLKVLRGQSDEARTHLDQAIASLTPLSTLTELPETSETDLKTKGEEANTNAADESTLDATTDELPDPAAYLNLYLTYMGTYAAEQDYEKAIQYGNDKANEFLKAADDVDKKRENLLKLPENDLGQETRETRAIKRRLAIANDFSAKVSIIAERIFAIAYGGDYIIEPDQKSRQDDSSVVETDEGEFKPKGVFALFRDHWEGPGGPAALYFNIRKSIDDAENGTNSNAIRRSIADATNGLAQLKGLRSNWAPASYLEGKLALLNGSPEKAVDAYQSAIRLGDARPITFGGLVQALYESNRAEEATEVFARFANQVDNSTDLTSIAFSLEYAQNNIEQAKEIVERRLAKDERDIGARLRLADLLQALDDNAEAEKQIQLALEYAPNSLQVWSTLIRFYLTTNQRTRAEETLAKLEPQVDTQDPGKKLDQPRTLVLSTLAAFYAQLDGQANLEKAELNLIEALESSPEERKGPLRMRLAEFYMPRDAAKAEAYLKQFPSNAPGYETAQLTLAAFLGRQNRWEDAEKVLNDLEKQNGNKAAIEPAIIQLKLRKAASVAGNAEQMDTLGKLYARSKAIMADKTSPSDSDYALLAGICLQQSEAPFPGDDDDDAALEKHHQLQREKLEEAVDIFVNLATQGDATEEQKETLARLRILYYEKVKGQLEELDRDERDERDLKSEMQRYIIAAGTVIRDLESESGFAPRIQALRLRWYRTQEKDDEAAKYIAENLQRKLGSANDDEARAELHLAASQLYRSMSRFEEAIEQAEAAFKVDPSQFSAVAVTKAEAGQTREALEFVQKIFDENDEDDKLLAARATTSILLKGKPTEEEFEIGDRILAKALEEFPDDPRLLSNIGCVRVVQNRDQDAVALYEKAIKASPNDPIVLNNYATLMLEQDDKSLREKALDRINRAVFLYGEEAALLDTKGMAQLANGQVDDAIETLTVATRKPTADARCFFHLALAFMERDEVQRAEIAYTRAKQEGLDDEILTSADQKAREELEKFTSASLQETGSP